MRVNPNSELVGLTRTISQTGAGDPRLGADQLSLTTTETLNRAWERTLATRVEKVAQAKSLIADVTYPPPECPYQTDEHQHGRIINVAEAFADASTRLVRDIPMGSPTWKAFYHRARNAVEGRNATFENWNFKRMSVFGFARSKAMLFLADVLDTLSTLARLVREATSATQSVAT